MGNALGLRHHIGVDGGQYRPVGAENRVLSKFANTRNTSQGQTRKMVPKQRGRRSGIARLAGRFHHAQRSLVTATLEKTKVHSPKKDLPSTEYPQH